VTAIKRDGATDEVVDEVAADVAPARPDPYGIDMLRARQAYLRQESATAEKRREEHRRALAGAGGARRAAISALAEVEGCRSMRAKGWANVLELAIQDLEEEVVP
jgi:hypothetical protein